MLLVLRRFQLRLGLLTFIALAKAAEPAHERQVAAQAMPRPSASRMSEPVGRTKTCVNFR